MLRILREDFPAAYHHLQLGFNEGYTLVAFPKDKEHVVLSDFLFYEAPGGGVEEYIHGSKRYQLVDVYNLLRWLDVVAARKDLGGTIEVKNLDNLDRLVSLVDLAARPQNLESMEAKNLENLKAEMVKLGFSENLIGQMEEWR